MDCSTNPRGSSVKTGGGCTNTIFDIQKKRRQEENLTAKKQELQQVLKSLKEYKAELNKKIKEAEDLHLSFDLFFKEEGAHQAIEKAERERKERLQNEAEIKRLMEEYAELMERKKELEHQLQEHTVYQDFMKNVVKMTKFEDVQQLTGQLESLLHFRDQLYQRDSEAQEQANQQKKTLLALQDQHHLQRLHKNNQLSQLQTKLENKCSKALIWERKWNHIQETAAKKTLLLGQIKMATLNLYEMTGDSVEGEERVDMNDTEKQLDKVNTFIQDHDDIVKQHQTPTQRYNTGPRRKEQKRDKPKSTTRHCKKDKASMLL